MINAILTGIFNLVIGLVNVILSPIESIISNYIPSLDNAFSMVSLLFDNLVNFIPWVISWTGLNSTILGLIVSYFTFRLTVPFLVHTVKLAISWYDKLKV